MRKYKFEDTGEVMEARDFFEMINSDAWESTLLEDGAWLITDENDEQRKIVPIPDDES